MEPEGSLPCSLFQILSHIHTLHIFEIRNNDSQQFWTKLCIQLVTALNPYNYYCQFIALYNNTSLPMLCKFFLVLNIINKFVYPGTYCATSYLDQVKVKLPLCLTKQRTMKTYWGSGDTAPRILDLGTRWRWVVSFTPRPLYPQGNRPW
jgi:hypothetical protein